MNKRNQPWEKYCEIVNSYHKKIENIESLEELFTYWKEAHEKCGEVARNENIEANWRGFSKDGFLGSREMFNKSDLKVLFILKEPNDPCPDGSFWFKDDVVEKDRNGGLLGSRVRMIYACLQGKNIINQDGYPKATSEELKYAAYMNLNKRGGSSKQSKDLEDYINTFLPFIIKEIQIINPEIIVCSGTYDFLKNFRLIDNKGRKWIAYWHFTNRKSNEANWNMMGQSIHGNEE